MNDANQYNDEQLAFILIGNKADLSTEASRAGSPCDRLLRDWCSHQQLLYGYNITYHPCSAKTGEGVNEAFSRLCKRFL